MLEFILFILGFLIGVMAHQRNLVLVLLPGTILHELTHYLMALLLGARPHPIRLLPKKIDDYRYELGSVQFYPVWWNGGVIALAPFLVWVFLYWIGASLTGFSFTLFSFCAGILAFSGFPSFPDWGIAIKYPFPLFVAIGLGYSWLWHQL